MKLLLVICLFTCSTVFYLQDEVAVGVLEGRVNAPSGQAVDHNVKIVVRNSQNVLYTFYTNKHGEFRLGSINQGVYFVEAGAGNELYEPVEERVEVPRGQVVHFSITLRSKKSTVPRTLSPGTVSANELNQKVPSSARKAYDRAMKLSSHGKAQEAVEDLRQAVTIYPDYIFAWNALGVQYLKLRLFEEAAKCFGLASGKDPGYFDSRFNLGLVRIEEKNYGDAIVQLNQAISIDSSRAGAHLWLGFTLLQTNQLPEAENELQKALIESNSGLVAAHFYLAQVYVKRGDLPEAARAASAYLEKAPSGEYSEDAKLLLKKLETRNRAPVRPR